MGYARKEHSGRFGAVEICHSQAITPPDKIWTACKWVEALCIIKFSV